MENKAVGWSRPEGSGQWVRVRMGVSDKWCPSGICVEPVFLISSLITQTKGSNAASPGFQMTPS